MSDEPVVTIMPGAVVIGPRPFPALPVEQPASTAQEGRCTARACEEPATSVFDVTGPLSPPLRVFLRPVSPGTEVIGLCATHDVALREWAAEEAERRGLSREPSTISGLTHHERGYLRRLVNRDLRDLAKKRRYVRPGEGEAEVTASLDARESRARAMLDRLGPETEEDSRDDA